jgi:hypothetical protein
MYGFAYNSPGAPTRVAVYQVLVLANIYYDIVLCVVLSLCPPLSIELYVGTILHTVATMSMNSTKFRFSNWIVRSVFFSRAQVPYNYFFANNNMRSHAGCQRTPES